MKITGGCYCGDIRYEADGDLEATFQCHCRECQYITGGHPNIVMIFAKKDFRFTSGSTGTFERPDLETPVKRHFCANCGTGIGSESPARPDSMIIKVGTVDDSSGWAPQFAQFTCDLQDFHHIADGLPSFDKRPPRKD